MDFERKAGNQYMDDERWPINPMWKTYPALLALQDPNIMHVYWEDFDSYTAGHYTITTIETGGGSATEALADGAGGLLLVTTDDGDNEGQEFQQQAIGAATAQESWKLSVGKPLWFEIRATLGDATQCDFIAGLCIADTILITSLSDGIYFLKDDDDRNFDYHVEKNNSDTSDDTGVDAVAAAYNRLGLYFNGEGTVEHWIDGVLVASTTTNIPDDEELSISFGILSGAAANKTLTVDYIHCAQIR